jgi:hypothetical protein
MFEKVTGMEQYPDYLQKDVESGILKVFSNGEINYKLRGVQAKVSVIWNFEAPEGTGDTHFSIMRGSICNLIIRQGAEQNYKPTLYIETDIPEGLETYEAGLSKAVNQDLAVMYPGLKLVKLGEKIWTVDIPDKYKTGHEAHFSQVTEKYLRYLVWGRLPEWEVPNMIVKYYTTTGALQKALENRKPAPYAVRPVEKSTPGDDYAILSPDVAISAK